MSGPIPRRVDAATKLAVLDLIGKAGEEGCAHREACRILELRESRSWRWQRRRDQGRLDDRPNGGNPAHGLLAGEVDAIVGLFDAWGEIDRSHRKLAHRGSYLGLVWVSPSSVKRVLAEKGLHLRAPKRPGRSQKHPWPDWVTYTPNEMWIYDTTHFTRAGAAVVVIVDMVSRKWLATNVSVEETSTQVQAVFWSALDAEHIVELIDARYADLDLGIDDERRPILLAISDNGPQMTSGSTREFMAICAIAQHHGRPHTPTDQAWIESFFAQLKREWPHLLLIDDVAVLRVELEHIRGHYNTVRLHEAIGYVTPDDEHEGRGRAIRAARKQGLVDARQRRIAYHRHQRGEQPPGPPR